MPRYQGIDSIPIESIAEWWIEEAQYKMVFTDAVNRWLWDHDYSLDPDMTNDEYDEFRGTVWRKVIDLT